MKHAGMVINPLPNLQSKRQSLQEAPALRREKELSDQGQENLAPHSCSGLHGVFTRLLLNSGSGISHFADRPSKVWGLGPRDAFGIPGTVSPGWIYAQPQRPSKDKHI